MTMTRKRIHIYISVLLIVSTAIQVSCIKNDIPYPRKVGAITAFEVRGQKGDAKIDNTEFTVTVDIADTVDMKKVKLLRFETTDSTSVEPEISSYLDFTQDISYTLSTYPDQSYLWKIYGTQTIERFIVAENQVGKAEFNVDEHYAILYVTEDQPLDNIVITDIQLGPSDSKISSDPCEIHDYTTVRKFTVTYRDVTEEWLINVHHKAAEAVTNAADAWACFAYLSGVYTPSLGSPSFGYRKVSESEWSEIPSEDVFIDGMNVSAILKGLEPSTEYIYKLRVGDKEGNEVRFMTEAALQMPNMGFDQWNTTGGVVYPNADQAANAWWDSGNTGAKLGGKTPTSQETSFLAVPGEGKSAARMETVNAIIAMAGGNVFSGHFGKVQGLGAEVFFGRPFESRPLRLDGWYCYTPKTINNVKPPSSPDVELPFDRNTIAGRMDRCHIFIYVTAWDGPYRVNTDEHRYLNINDPDVIGYGELIDSVGTGGEYRKFSIDIKYRDNRKPTYCAVVAVASQYADYFTGGIGSLMYVDEFSFVYEGDVKWEDR